MRWWAIFLGVGFATAAACSLNPQPFPPETPDGSADSAGINSGDADASDASLTTGLDSAPPTGDDAGDATLDGGDASDADTDADVRDADGDG